MRLALNEDLEEDEEEVMMEEEELEENAAYKVSLNTSQFFKVMSEFVTSSTPVCRQLSVPLQGENGFGPEKDRRGSLLTTPTGNTLHYMM